MATNSVQSVRLTALLRRERSKTGISEARLRGYRDLAEAILLMAIRDWAGTAEVKGRRRGEKARLKALYTQDAREFWNSSWAKTLCDYVGWRYRIVSALMYEAEANPARMREVSTRLKRSFPRKGESLW